MPDESILNQQPTAEAASGGIFDILSKLMQNGGAVGENTPSAEKPASEPNILSSLLSNPELIAKLPELISVISPLMSSISSQSNFNAASANHAPSVQASAAPTHAQNKELQNRAALLCALKPYVKKERQDAIDYMIKLSRLGDILKTL